MTRTEPHEPRLPGGDEQLEQDLAVVLGAVRAPEGLYDDLHMEIDKGLADGRGPSGRQRVVLVVLGAATTVAIAAAAMLMVLAPWRQPDAGLQMRGGAPPELEFAVMSVTESGDNPTWLHDGDPVPADRWLAFQVKASPEAEVVLVRFDGSSGPEVFGRTRAPAGADPLMEVEVGMGYRLATLAGHQSFGCAVAGEPLDDDQIAALVAGGEDAPVAAWQYLVFEVVSP